MVAICSWYCHKTSIKIDCDPLPVVLDSFDKDSKIHQHQQYNNILGLILYFGIQIQIYHFFGIYFIKKHTLLVFFSWKSTNQGKERWKRKRKRKINLIFTLKDECDLILGKSFLKRKSNIIKAGFTQRNKADCSVGPTSAFLFWHFI